MNLSTFIFNSLFSFESGGPVQFPLLLEVSPFYLVEPLHTPYTSPYSFFYGNFYSFFFPTGEAELTFQFLTMVSIFFICFYVQYRRLGNTLPIFDPGIILLGVTVLYCAFPILGFALSGFHWSEISDRRLLDYKVTSSMLSDFMWHHFYYVLAIGLSYLCFTKRHVLIDKSRFDFNIKKRDLAIILFSFAFMSCYSYVIGYFFTAPYPHFILQLNNNFSSVKFVLTLWLFVFAFSRWEVLYIRFTLLGYLVYQCVATFLFNQGRTWLFLQVMACIMLYHFFVKKISIKSAVGIFAMLLVVFLAKGFYKVGMFQYFGEYSIFSASNEFVTMIGTAFDLKSRLYNGLVSTVPVQAYFNDLLLLIPSQFLPFPKLDLSQWYLQIRGLQGRGVGMMFGVISQGIIGGGIPELIIRGGILGFLFAKAMNWFNGLAKINIWHITFMVFIAIKSYYTYRAGTGYIIYFVVYHFCFAYMATKAALWVINRLYQTPATQSKTALQ